MAAVSSISQQIWDMKYRLKGPDGAPVDKTIEDSWWRVAQALAEPEQDRDRWAAAFYEAMEGFRFLPAGRIVLEFLPAIPPGLDRRRFMAELERRIETATAALESCGKPRS